MTRPSTHPDAIDHAIAAFYKDTVAERGFPPTFAEIAEHVGFTSKSSVHHRMPELVSSGLIPGYYSRTASRARAQAAQGTPDEGSAA